MTNDNPFFIIGNPRSGTTLLEIVLDNHSNLAVCPESGIFKNLKRVNAQQNFSTLSQYKLFIKYTHDKLKNFHDPAANVLDIFAKETPVFKGKSNALLNLIGIKYAEKKQKKIVGEKSPEHIYCLPLIRELFPESKLIIIYRNPADIICSLVKRYPEQKRKFLKTGTILTCATFVKSGFQAVQDFLKDKPENVLTIRYEDFVSNPENILEKICTFLNVPFEKELVNFNAAAFVIKGNKNLKKIHSGLLQPINSDKVNQYKKYFSGQELLLIKNFMTPALNFTSYKIETRQSKLSAVNSWMLYFYLFKFKLQTYKWNEFLVIIKSSIKILLKR